MGFNTLLVELRHIMQVVVEAGDQLILQATLTRALRGIWKFDTEALVDGQVVCAANMMVAPKDKACSV